MANYHTITLMLAAFAAQSAVVFSCNFPPALWCTSEEIAKTCNVVQQCAEWSSVGVNAPKVNLTLYYESYCGGCQVFIVAQLNKAYTDLSDIMHLTMVPYGNAMETKNGSVYEFQCQHGEIECQGNLLETCLLHYASFPTAFKTIYCMEFSQAPVPNAQKCMEKMGVDYQQVSSCANSSLGNALEHQMALKTDALKPPHQYVPWVTLNGVHTEQIQQAAENNLSKLICDTYRGTKPPACSQDKPKLESCIRE